MKSISYIRYFFTLALLLTVVTAFGAGVTFTGSKLEVIEETPARSTGLDKIFVIYDVKDVQAVYRANSDASVTWYKYGELGGGDRKSVV